MQSTGQKYKTPDAEDIRFFESVCGADYQSITLETRKNYGHDETEELVFLPDVVLKPSSEKEISAILTHCNRHKIAVTARGAGTGLSGGALPVKGGVTLSLERLNKLIEIDERNLQATVEPGVITQILQEEVAKKGLFYPPDPASKGSCFIGGNVAEGSGGPKCVKYGTTKDYILNLQVVLCDGTIIWTGANTLKNSTGYHLTQLMVGSEGTLGIVTKIVVKLLPLPKHNILMLVPFYNLDDACSAVSEVFKAGFIPSALELMERDALEWVSRYVESTVVQLQEGIQAHLLIELDGNNLNQLTEEMEAIAVLLERYKTAELLFADSAAQKDELWKLRRKINEAVKANAVSKEQDTVVPRAELPALVKGVKSIGKKYGFQSVCYGHAGDGNLHIRIIKGNLSDEQWDGEYIKKAIAEIFTLCRDLKGTISGEHGIGWIQKEYMPLVLDKANLEIQRKIKLSFDPNEILNPGKIVF